MEAAREVAPGVYRLTHGISNFYLVERDSKLTMVDAGVPRDWSRFQDALRLLGRSASDLEAIVLTHAHSDHTGFAERARSLGSARVWVHELDEAVAKGAKPSPNEGKAGPYLKHAETWRTLFGLLFTGGTRIVPVLEASTFADQTILGVPGKLRVIHMPGHTPGSSALFLEDASVVFTGDSLVMRNPLTGRRGPQIMPGALNRSNETALQSLDRLAPIPARTLLSGHGDPWTDGTPEAVRLAKTAGTS